MNELNKHIENINKLVEKFWNTGDLDPWKMFDLIVSKTFILEYIEQYPLQKPSRKEELKKELEKINAVLRKYHKDTFPLPSGLKKGLIKDVITIEEAKRLLKSLLKIVKNLELPEACTKSYMRMVEQMLLGKYE